MFRTREKRGHFRRRRKYPILISQFGETDWAMICQGPTTGRPNDMDCKRISDAFVSLVLILQACSREHLDRLPDSFYCRTCLLVIFIF
ncbi:MAG: hypothetical protein [Sclerotinia sclerotiorum narnavirus 1]|nr:MAG: hypothetical protein [Sclerotinia sclerotiorum narnavirus 1]